MVTFEETERTPNGLDFLIKAEYGGWLAWAYDRETAALIVNALNNYDTDSDGNVVHQNHPYGRVR